MLFVASTSNRHLWRRSPQNARVHRAETWAAATSLADKCASPPLWIGSVLQRANDTWLAASPIPPHMFDQLEPAGSKLEAFPGTLEQLDAQFPAQGLSPDVQGSVVSAQVRSPPLTEEPLFRRHEERAGSFSQSKTALIAIPCNYA